MSAYFLALLAILASIFSGGCGTSHPSYHGQTPLMVATRHDEINRVRALILSGSAVNAVDDQGHTALTYAAGQGNTKILKVLLMGGADIHYNNEQALFDSVMGGHRESAKYLLKSGADVNVMRPGGYRLLMRCVQGGDYGMTKLLIDAGADVNAKSDYGDTAIQYARSKRYSEIADLLKMSGAIE